MKQATVMTTPTPRAALRLRRVLSARNLVVLGVAVAITLREEACTLTPAA